MCPSLGDPMGCSTQSSPVLHCLPELLKFMSIEWVMLSNNLILCCPFSFCLQSFPASGSFPMCHLFSLCGKSIGASATSLPMNIKGWCPLGLTGLVFLLSKGLSRVFTSTYWQVANSSFAFWKSPSPPRPFFWVSIHSWFGLLSVKPLATERQLSTWSWEAEEMCSWF